MRYFPSGIVSRSFRNMVSSNSNTTAFYHKKSSSQSNLSQFSTCELSDALIKLGSPNGGLLPDIKRMSHYEGSSIERICGPAYTVQMVLASDKEAPKLSEHFVDTIEEGSIVVIDTPPRECALCITEGHAYKHYDADVF